MMLRIRKVPANVKGIPILVSKAIRVPRNIHVTTNTIIKPMVALVCIKDSALRVLMVWSSTKNILTPVLVLNLLRSSM